jgi:hypothetical protein
MPWTPVNPLCTLADVKEALRIPTADVADDNRLNLAIDAASRMIENRLNRRFFLDANPTARVYIADSPFLVSVDDFQTTVGLVVQTDPAGDGSFGLTWTSADYQLEPLNAQLSGQPWVFNKIRAIRSLLFPVYGQLAYGVPYQQALIQVTARWGWTSVPTDITKAAIIQTIALFKADDAPFGSTPFGETGIVRLKQSLHPTAAALVEPYDAQEVLIG